MQKHLVQPLFSSQSEHNLPKGPFFIMPEEKSPIRNQFGVCISRYKIQAALFLAAFFLISLTWTTTTSRIEFEYQAEIRAITRQNANLTRIYEESVRQHLQRIEELLLFLKENYEQHRQVTPEMISRMRSTSSLPIVHVSLINDSGMITYSTLPRLVSMNVADGEYFQAFRRSDDKQTYFAKPIIGRDTKQWLFHASRRISNPDGSLGGAINIGVEPAYFAAFFRLIDLGDGYGITLLGKDGYVRIRQTKQRMDVGSDARGATVFKLLPTTSSGAYTDVSVVDQTRRIYTWRAMPDFPFILSVSVLEAEALADFYHRKERYHLIAIATSTSIALFFALLIWMVTQKFRSEEQLKQAHAQLELKITERTTALQLANQELQRLTSVDGLTAIANRRRFDEYIGHEGLRTVSLAIIMLDIDWFKKFNDQYGHLAGDECLKQVARALESGVRRTTDLVARYGGEEFVVVLPDTPSDGASRLAEKLRARIEALDLTHQGSPYGRVTISLGVAATASGHMGPMNLLIHAADQALFEAKNSGKNCVRQAPDLE